MVLPHHLRANNCTLTHFPTAIIWITTPSGLPRFVITLRPTRAFLALQAYTVGVGVGVFTFQHQQPKPGLFLDR